MDLTKLGWTPILSFHLDELRDPALLPGRLATVDRGRAVALAATGPVPVAWKGPVPLQGATDPVIPAVGDWAALGGEPDLHTITSLLPRASLLARGHAEGARLSQPLAANVDVVLIVTGLDGDFSLRPWRAPGTPAPSWS